MYKYTDSCNREHKVPRVRALSLDQIRRGDHICFPRSAYWHHAIVEAVDESNGEVNVIEYSNSAKQFSQDNSSPPKNPGLAVVVRRKFKLKNESVYVIQHDRCHDPETVVSRAKSKLRERKYNPVTNNCEHFALWSKTGISSSEQVNNIKDAFKTGLDKVKDPALKTGAWRAVVEETQVGVKEIVKTEVSREVTKEFVSHTIQGNGQQIVSSEVRAISPQVITQTTAKTEQEVVKTGMTAMTEQVAAQRRVIMAGKDVALAGMSGLTKQVAAPSTVMAGKEVATTGISAMTKQAAAQSRVIMAGKDVALAGMSGLTKQVAAQSTVIAGKDVAKTGMSALTKQVVTQTTSSTGQEMVKTGVHVATKEVATQGVSNTGREFVKTGVRLSTKEVVTETVSKTGQEVVKTGTRTTTKEVVTQTSTEVGRESIAGGLAYAVAFASLFAVYDIKCAYSDKQEGKISQSQFNEAIGKRIVTGTFNVAGSTVGAAIGQAVIPVPLVGGFVGGIVGSVIGKAIGGRAVS